jgi:hypothetical protein
VNGLMVVFREAGLTECVDVLHYHGIRPSSVSGVVALKGNVGGEVFCPSIGLDLI